jgi:hypothetical protein
MVSSAPLAERPVGGLTPGTRRWLLVSMALVAVVAAAVAGARRPPGRPRYARCSPWRAGSS